MVTSTLRRHPGARRGQRGVTVYVVVLILAMLSAVGIFATKSSSLALAQGGYVRQAAQSHYIASYAIDATVASIGTDVPGYIQQFDAYDEAQAALTVGSDWNNCRTSALQNDRCFKFSRIGLEARLGGAGLLVDRAPGNLLDNPGSLGRADVEAHFMVEATDLAQVMSPIAGERATDAPVRYYNVTLSAVGDVGPRFINTSDQLRLVSNSTEAARVQLTLGPVPAR